MKRLLRWMLFVVPAAMITVVALADYIGPNRTRTVADWQRRKCGYRAIYDPPGAGYYSCRLTLYYPPDASCPSTSDVAALFNPNPHSCGPSWPGTCGRDISCQIRVTANTIQACRKGDPGCKKVTRTIHLPPATVAGNMTCSNPGNNGWCRGGAGLQLSASEPLSGYVITLIEDSNGTLCDPPDAPNVSCTWTGGGEGNTTITFWAHSSYGDTSMQQSVQWMVDGTPPTVTFTFDIGLTVTIYAHASDAVSGLDHVEYRVDGGAWQTGTSVTLVSNGMHTVEWKVFDVAGNMATAIHTVYVGPPTASLSVKYGGLPYYAPKLGLPAQTLYGGISGGAPPYTAQVDVTSPDGTVRTYTMPPSLVLDAAQGGQYFGTDAIGTWAAVMTVQDAAGRTATSNTVTWTVQWYPVHETP